jgi:tetratricopeptide (TPR) repeat protein
VLSQAKRLLDKGEAESAATVLRRFLATSPRPEHLDDTYLLLGAALYSMKEYSEAIKYLNQLQTEFPASDVNERGKIMLARTHAAMGNIDLALPLLTQLRAGTIDEDTKHEALRLTAEFLVQKKEYVRAIEALLQESAAGTEEHVAETRAQIREFINEKLDKKALTRLHDLYPKSFPGDLAAIRLALVRGGTIWQNARSEFLAQFPEHPYGPRAPTLAR